MATQRPLLRPTDSVISVIPSAASVFISPSPPLPDVIVSRKDVLSSVRAYECLIEAGRRYRKQLNQLAEAAADFGEALEMCAREKGAKDEASVGLMAASGMQHVIGNHHQILAETIYRHFEAPLLQEIDFFKEQTQGNEDEYVKEAIEKTKLLRKREVEHLKLAKKKKRNLALFRAAVVELTKQLDEIDRIKYDHYKSALSLAEETSVRVLSAASLVVRAEAEVYEGIAKKGWSGGGLEDVISKAQDWSGVDGNLEHNGIFSVLPAQSILACTQSPRVTHATSKSLHNVLPEDYLSDEDDRSIFSAPAQMLSIDNVITQCQFSTPNLGMHEDNNDSKGACTEERNMSETLLVH